MGYREQIKTLIESIEPSLRAYVEGLRERAEREGLVIALYGIGRFGKIWLSYFEEQGIEIAFLVDQYREGKEDGIQILSPAELASRTGGKVLLLVTPLVITKSAETREAFASSMMELSLTNIEFISSSRTRMPHLRGLDYEATIAAFNMLEDSLSRYSYYEYLRHSENDELFCPPYFEENQQYLANDLFELTEKDYVVDCGAYTGDTVEAFARYYPFLRGITAFEPTPETFLLLQETARKTSVPVETIQKATGEAAYEGSFLSIGASVGNCLIRESKEENDVYSVEVCTLDDTVADKHPTFIKMDVEGYELETLRGCASIIKKDSPILAVCIYHKAEDLYTIPFFLKECNPEYKFFARKYGDEQTELILFAIPPHRLRT